MATFYGIDVVNGVITAASDFNEQLSETAPVTQVLHAKTNIGGGTVDLLTHLYGTPAGIPGLTEWSAGDYIAYVNCTTIGANVTFTFRIARYNSAGVFIQSYGSSAVFNTPGLKTYTHTQATPITTAAGDLLVIEILTSRAASHGTQTLEISIGTSGNLTRIETPFSTAVIAKARLLIIEDTDEIL